MNRLLLLVHGVLITALLVALTDASFTGAILTALGIGIVAYLVGIYIFCPEPAI